MTPDFTDKMGTSLERGDLICYAVRQGNSAGLEYGIATHTKETNSTWNNIPRSKLAVIIETDDWTDGNWTKKPKQVYLEAPSRVLKINRDQIPNDTYDLIHAEFVKKS